MSHRLCLSLFHIVFSTKQRRSYIPKSSLENTWAYVAGIARNHQMRVFAVGGTQNHIHALVDLPPEPALADAVRTLKCNSSRWMRESVRLFQWQQGYGAFSVSPSQLGRVVNYVSHQAQHHARYSFEEELRAMLKAAGMNGRFDDDRVAPDGGLLLHRESVFPTLPRWAGIVTGSTVSKLPSHRGSGGLSYVTAMARRNVPCRSSVNLNWRLTGCASKLQVPRCAPLGMTDLKPFADE